MRFLVINGPNLNLLGTREPEFYGSRSYAALVRTIRLAAASLNVRVKTVQSNYEGKIVGYIQRAAGKYDGIVINPAAYTHTSVAILDALKAVGLPAVEVHLSDIQSREEFRRHSFISPACLTTIAGKGFDGYRDAIAHLAEYLNSRA
jgi:3-dehydroquinate dehydratase-2